MSDRQAAFFAEPTEQAGEEECVGMVFPNDEERRKHFLEKLREKLKDPELRKIERKGTHLTRQRRSQEAISYQRVVLRGQFLMLASGEVFDILHKISDLRG